MNDQGASTSATLGFSACDIGLPLEHMLHKGRKMGTNSCTHVTHETQDENGELHTAIRAIGGAHPEVLATEDEGSSGGRPGHVCTETHSALPKVALGSTLEAWHVSSQ